MAFTEKTKTRVISITIGLIMGSTALTAWMFEVVPNNYAFDHSFKFVISALLITCMLITVAVRGKWPSWLHSSNQGPNKTSEPTSLNARDETKPQGEDGSL